MAFPFDHKNRRFHGEQSIALTLTTKTWMDELIEIPETSWIHGGTPPTVVSFRGASNR